MNDLKPLELPSGISEDAALQLLEHWADGRPIMEPATFAELREAIGTRLEAADRMGVDRKSIHRYENGERTIGLLPALQIRRAYRSVQAARLRTAQAAKELADG